MQRPEPIIYNGVKFYACLYSGRWYYRSSSTSGSLLHRAVWQAANGAIPKGFHIHHKNNDSTDNRIENLELLSKSKHFLQHHNPVISGAKGGASGTGASKARTSEQARAAALRRWSNHRPSKANL